MSPRRRFPAHPRLEGRGFYSSLLEHRISYRSTRWGYNLVVITPALSRGRFGRSRREWLMDGSERRWRSWPAFRRALAQKHGMRP